jgi:hypothetical protein
LDGDGRDDVISGSYSPGYLFLFAKQEDGTFAAGERIKDKDGKSINVGYASAVYAADWDADGDLDLVVGNISGEVYFIPNEGDAETYAYGAARKLSAGGAEIRAASGDAGPVLTDWDGDGLLDLLVGAGDGSVTLYRNTGAASHPELAAGKVLIAASAAADDTACGRRAKLCVTDFNGDGRPDLLVGDWAYVQPKPKQLTAEEQEQARKAQQEYEDVVQEYLAAYNKTELPSLQREYSKLVQAPANETPEAAEQREAKADEVRRKMEQIQQKELKPLMDKLTALAQKLPNRAGAHHGFVWLYLRQAPSGEAGKGG